MSSSMLANGSDHYPSPNGPTTTTTMSKLMREFKFTRRGPGGYVEEVSYRLISDFHAHFNVYLLIAGL